MERKKKILICNHNRDILEMMKEVLNTFGYETIIHRLSENFPTKEDYKPDAILFEAFSDLEGYIKKFRKNFPDTPLVVFSTSSYTREELLALGADGYISKPFTLENLSNELERIFKKKLNF